ncbi:UNVERIFIED_CONTAM: hypothetical protein Sindi_1796700 [Sesamum indicum]
MLGIETQTAIRKGMLPNHPQKPSNRAVTEKMKGKKVAEEVGRDKAVAKEQVAIETAKAFERGESSRYPTNPSNDDVDSDKRGTDIADIETSDVNYDSNMENEMHVDNANWSAHEPADNLVVGENHVVVHDNIVSVLSLTLPAMMEKWNSDKVETLVSDATPLKICEPPCLTNCNPADSIEQLLLELASPDKLPRNDFIVERLPEYLVKNTSLKFRVMKQRSTPCGPIYFQ